MQSDSEPEVTSQQRQGHVTARPLAAGIWTKDLKNKTNLQQPQVTKILKNLDARGLVKSVKAVAHPTRKLYMLAELEPARELTGGSWCARTAQLGTSMQPFVGSPS